jgi:hypothetical protein
MKLINYLFDFTCKLLGLAGETEHPLSFVDEILPDGLVLLSFADVPILSALLFRLVVIDDITSS